MKAESSSPVDWASLLHAMGGDREILEEMVRLFLELGPAQVRDMEAALAEGDPDSVRSAAHRLKGSLSQFLAEKATNLAAVLEKHGGKGDLVQANLLWPTLREEIQRLVMDLDGGV